ncbi:MAG TPA: YHS domain-containing protein [Bryobacteraceae bacterium]|nr:YHS domain-containing protein [Bryobacteraceae bacterium]
MILTLAGNRTPEKRVLALLTSAAETAQEGGHLPDEMKRDPVCHMDVEPTRAAGTSKYKGDTYYFCSTQCKQRFDADPESFVSRSESSQS